ncbi:transcriptional regulator [Alkalihalobacillus alcalophilus ATCC 27647 = CGMCC 1.3604]|uniref:Transcriptional regulator n=2 Tax=Alkalihalobacillus alcalophilus TaxID=1445 RepID=A0A094WNH1_ALKAL|nr:DeoR/GlpR family DNA-binding transcription regulator [Alkalihalobacillus alcalophilus]KGA98386.1 transcriptional regulator [Alkalihalobacillus alcalophilus ATCC 27647 = CGMCC 1.3604]MED1563919.1 DeoR/GlpR family DNA-binding transcription regulator [Alkalihalobacillus alcalophilus]THG91591.1 transcriptional regulator [Alkalihalobacillus alcalophilus ATCC 27647 = CGMCC 1.3604]
MFMHERRSKILDYLNKEQRVTVKELAKRLSVSEATLRTDFSDMEKEGLLKRTHGGAIIGQFDEKQFSFSNREKKNKEEKSLISIKAEKLISANQCILLDASSTALELAKRLKENPKRLTIVTNGIYTALELRDVPEFTVILIGGVIRTGSGSLESTIDAGLLSKINIDLMFTSASGFDFEKGLTDFNVYEVELKKEMVKASSKVIALLDYSKFGKSSLVTFATVDEISTIITDGQLSNEYIQLMEKSDIKLL